MEEPSSEDADNIDFILSSLRENTNIRTERVTPRGSTIPVNNVGNDQSLDLQLFINEAEVVFEDGVSINDIVSQEITIHANGDIFVETNNELEDWQNQLTEDTDIIMPDLEELDSVAEINNVAEVAPNLCSLEEGEDDESPARKRQKRPNRSDWNVVNNELEDRQNKLSEDPDFIVTPSDLEDQDSDNSVAELNSVAEVAPDLCSLEVGEDDEFPARKRQKRPNVSDWNVVKNKNLRMTGKRYIGYKKVKVGGKVVVKMSDGDRAERKMGPMCVSSVCKANKKRKCTEINQDQRCNIFKHFWPLSWSEKKVYIRAHVKKTKKKQLTVKERKESRRSDTFKYYLSTNNELKPVCKVMFLNTLGLKEWMVQNWVKNDNDEEIFDEQTEELTEDDVQIENGEAKGKNGEKYISEKKKIMVEWFEKLPKVPAHYCRASSSKLYLEPLWQTKKELYDTYKEYCNENRKLWGSLTLFMQVFESNNLSIYVPKKDQCDSCYSYKAGNISKGDYDKHLIDKELARKEKDNDKKLALDGQIYCLTADVQSVKLTPTTKASAMYYKTKLCCHNYTVYNLETRHCTCYWFTEVEGDLSANSFASCLVDYLKENCLDPKRPITIFTDGCTNQIRNQYVSNALLHFAVQNQIEVTQKYLVKGHTQMEGDSVHARIEKTIKGRDIYVPYEYVKYTKQARTNPSPYEAKYLKYNFFKDFGNISYYDSIRPGKKKGDPVVTDVHYLQYLRTGEIFYKLAFNDLPKMLPRRPKLVDKTAEPTQLFKEQLKIPYTKWKHLQDLKTVIPSDYHNFYDHLPYQNYFRLI